MAVVRSLSGVAWSACFLFVAKMHSAARAVGRKGLAGFVSRGALRGVSALRDGEFCVGERVSELASGKTVELD